MTMAVDDDYDDGDDDDYDDDYDDDGGQLKVESFTSLLLTSLLLNS